MASSNDLAKNKSISMLRAAEEGKYGVLGVVCYNLETIAACIQAAEAKNSPVQILLFPWALAWGNGLLATIAAHACRNASIPATLHLDHAQDEGSIQKAADSGLFDSIMVDMSHYSKEENLEKTTKWVKYCRDRGIATEAEPGRMTGGEDGVKATDADMEGVLTSPEEAGKFVDTGIQFLAPAFGNLHGEYGGVENMKLDFDRLDSLRPTVGKASVRLVLHGTNGFPPELLSRCVEHGMTRLNVNDLVVRRYNEHLVENSGKLPLTQLIEEGTKLMREDAERWMDIIGSSGKAT